MRSLGHLSGAGRTLFVVVALAALGTRPARSAPPACFPTRYVGNMTSLVVGHRRFGVLAPGQLVTVVEEEVPIDWPGVRYTLARIEIERPVHFTALAPPRDLDVFLRHDVPIEPGATWWLAGTAMKVTGSHDRRAEIDRAGSGRQFPVTVGCDELVAEPPGGKAESSDDCEGCTPEPPLPARAVSGPGVCWQEQSFEVPGPSGTKVIIHSSDGSLVRKEGERALVEIIDDDARLRLWRWLPIRALKPSCDRYGVGSINLCSLASGVDKGLRAGVLDATAPLLPSPGAPPIMALPAGTVVVWDQEQDGWRRVLIRWPNAHWDDDWTLEVAGFVPSASLRPARRPRRAKWLLRMPDYVPSFSPLN